MSTVKAVVMAGTVGAFALAVPRAAHDQPLTLHFREITTRDHVVDRGRRGPSIGDVDVSGGRLVGDSGEPLGTFAASCVTVDIGRAAARQCSGAEILAGGQLTYVGASIAGRDTQLMAITGGTDDYLDARGQIELVRVTSRVAAVTVTLLE